MALDNVVAWIGGEKRDLALFVCRVQKATEFPAESMVLVY